MSAQLLGAHMPSKGGLGATLRSGKEIGCTAVQVFTSSPRQWYSKPVAPEAVLDFQRAMEETGIRSVVSHDSYLINLCAPDPETATKSFGGLKGEIARCGLYGIPYVVSHMGAYKGQEHAECLVRVAEATKAILADTPDTVTLCMETTAGQGSSLNSRFEELAMILELCGGHPRLGVCLDTCHVFAAGYDIRTEEGFSACFDEFTRVVGFERLKVVHCNDSKKELGSRVDRHEHIGKGFLGEKPFLLLVNDRRFDQIPILLETPDAETMHEVNLNLLKGLRAA